MNRNKLNLLITGLAMSATLVTSFANASDDRMWREQVAKASDTVIKLESRATDPDQKIGNDSLLWREQVKPVTRHRVFLLQPAPVHYARSSDTRMWREQVKPQSPRRSLRTAGISRRDGKPSPR